MERKINSILFIIFLSLGNLVLADDAVMKNWEFHGWGFYRFENKKEADYNSSTFDKRQSSLTRIDVSAKADLAENYGYVYFAPQFSKLSGQDEIFLTSTTPAASSQQTSGSIYSPNLNVHEAYFAVHPTQEKELTFFLGRQELNYGDQLIMGAVPWSRFGRSFDALKIRYLYYEKMTLDLFTAKLQDNNYLGVSSGPKPDDSNLHGIYASSNLGVYLKNMDLYFLRKNGNTSSANLFLNTSALGFRAKSAVGETSLDYRAEYTFENTVLIAGAEESKSQHQFDIEVGYTHSFHNSRLALEYFESSKNFDQLFPTGHKFLGYADQFSRRNIKGYVVHFSTLVIDKLSILLDYHFFYRYDGNTPAYNFAGNSLGTLGSNNNIATEFDVTTVYNFTSNLQASVGYAIVDPKSYIEDQVAGNTKNTEFSYFQLLAKF